MFRSETLSFDADKAMLKTMTFNTMKTPDNKIL